MNTYDRYQRPYIFGERSILASLVAHGVPREHLGWMSAMLGLTEAAKAHLANPQLKLMIVGASYGAETDALRHFRIAPC